MTGRTKSPEGAMRKHRRGKPRAPRGAVLAGGLAALAAVASAVVGPASLSAWQAPAPAERLSDARWAPFVGCWEPVDPAEDAAGGLLCVRPAGGGVEMFSVADGQTRTSDLLVANGEPRQLRAEGCEGTETVAFSEDGRRAFTRSAVSCDGVEQRSTGVLSMVAPAEWIDARSLEVDGERTAWVQRYRLVGPERAAEEGVPDPTFGMETAARTSRLVAHRGVGLDQVIEAVERVDAETVETWLAARGEGFAPTADDLERLADAGVPETVIDVVVAVSFPETFQVTPEGDAEMARGDRAAYARDYAGWRRPFPWGARSWFGYRMYGYGFHPADPLFYGYGYGYPGYWGYRPGVVIIERRDRGPVGRILPGRGYTRGDDAGRRAAPRGEAAPSGGDRPSAAPPRRSGGDASPAPRDDQPERRPARPRGPGG